MYLTFSDYQNMGGTLDETAFNDFEFEAESVVNWYTFNRFKKDSTFPEELKRCMYVLIKYAQERQELTANGPTESEDDGITAIASRSNDGVSVSYNVMSASELFDSLKKEMGTTVQRYLNGVVNELGRRVLYKGLYPGE